MNTKRLIGYLLMIVGVALLFLQTYRGSINMNLPKSIPTNIVWIASVVAIVLGFWLTLKSKGQALEEVPIYAGEKIIGYRRH